MIWWMHDKGVASLQSLRKTTSLLTTEPLSCRRCSFRHFFRHFQAFKLFLNGCTMFCFDSLPDGFSKKPVDRCQDCCLRGLKSFTEASLSSVPVCWFTNVKLMIRCWIVVTKAEMILNYCEKSWTVTHIFGTQLTEQNIGRNFFL